MYHPSFIHVTSLKFHFDLKATIAKIIAVIDIILIKNIAVFIVLLEFFVSESTESVNFTLFFTVLVFTDCQSDSDKKQKSDHCFESCQWSISFYAIVAK